MSDTESSSTSILVTQRNEEDTENDTEIEEIPQEKHWSTGPINPALQSFNYEFPISMAQSINQDPLSNENDNDQDQAESINNDIQTIVQPTTSSNLAPRKRGRPRKNP
ncbi:hypothetical protein BpHYR1_033710 [Brachionus plicatilis]|uniref:Uncharacterized protein n=1 Tax=Brachionus plicatilis TaxID=10195 RepID=A0A3M7RNP8_BRAPC|nr:hypothetical protein BpHYR1_033710 [Brachionus plicatilis]